MSKRSRTVEECSEIRDATLQVTHRDNQYTSASFVTASTTKIIEVTKERVQFFYYLWMVTATFLLILGSRNQPRWQGQIARRILGLSF